MATKEVKPEYDFSKLTPAEMVELAAKLQAQAQEGIQKEFEADINYIVSRAKNFGKTLTNYVSALIELMDAEEKNAMYTNVTRAKGGVITVSVAARKRRSPNGSAAPKAKPESMDSTGARPVIGTTYQLAGHEPWKCESNGRAKTEYVAAIKAGKTWAELTKK